MSIYTGLINWHRKRRVTEAILNICLGVKSIEEDNTKIVKYKLRAYKILGKRRKETEASTEYVYVIGELTTAVQWQKNIFEDLSNISYIAETNTQDVKFDERTKPLQEKLIEARMLIDSLVTMYLCTPASPSDSSSPRSRLFFAFHPRNVPRDSKCGYFRSRESLFVSRYYEFYKALF